MQAVKITLLAALCLLALAEARAQEVSPPPGIDGFVGHGIARITGGDMQSARQSALADAQLKAVMDGAFSVLPAESAAPQSSKLFSRFAGKPERFVRSYRIVSERSFPEQYQVVVQAALDMDGLRQEMAAMGLVKAAAANRSIVLLIMAAESALDERAARFWWSPDAGADPGLFPAQQALETAFADSQTKVVSPFTTPLQDMFRTVGLSPDPDPAAVAQLAVQTQAQMVLLVRSVLKRAPGRQPVSVKSVQCDLDARVVDVRRGETIAQSVTCGLGTHVDEAEAAREAIQKAARQLADQVSDRLYQQLRQAREYVFKLRFNRPVSDADARDCINAFKQVLPGLELIDMMADDGKEERWNARVTSPAEDAQTLMKMFGPGVVGYVTKVTSVQDNAISIRVTPIARK